MAVHGLSTEPHANGRALHWPNRVVTAAGLETRLNGHRELVLPAGAVVTPLAEEHLRQRGVATTWAPPAERAAASWGCAGEAHYPLVDSALLNLAREGVAVRALPACRSDAVCDWACAVAACVAAGQCRGGVVFCGDPGLVCCVANKVPGLRAVAVTTVAQAARATLTAGANLLAVEMPGRTFWEVRQILKLACECPGPNCPVVLAETLRGLDGHAHR